MSKRKKKVNLGPGPNGISFSGYPIYHLSVLFTSRNNDVSPSDVFITEQFMRQEEELLRSPPVMDFQKEEKRYTKEKFGSIKEEKEILKDRRDCILDRETSLFNTSKSNIDNWELEIIVLTQIDYKGDRKEKGTSNNLQDKAEGVLKANEYA